MDELERAAARYAQRDASAALTGFWTLRNPVVLHIAQERERAALRLLERCGVELQAARILDAGCGLGLEFANLLRWGAEVDGLCGIDLMHGRLRAARARSGAALAQASVAALPFADASFDLVCQNVVFSSIIDPATRRAAAAELLRVLRPAGHVLWYDAFRSRAKDPHFRPVPRAEIDSLFPGLEWTFVTLTTDLGLSVHAQRWLGAWTLPLLDRLGFVRTHLLGIGRLRR